MALLGARSAHAEPVQYLEAGLMFGAAEPVGDGYNVLASVGAGYRLTDLLWARAGVGYGTSVDRFGQHVPNGGRNGLVRAGVEARWCAAAMLCGLAGADLAVQHGTWQGQVYSDTAIGAVDQSISETALLVVPRVGIDFGGDSLRARVTVEADTALVARTTTMTGGMATSGSPGGVIGVELAAGVAYQW